MRRKSENVLDFDFEDHGLPKVTVAFRNKYRQIHQVLLGNPKILALAHEDFKKLSEGKGGRAGDYTTETILRTLIIHFLEGKSLRETVVLISESQFLQNFTLVSAFSRKGWRFIRPSTHIFRQQRGCRACEIHQKETAPMVRFAPGFVKRR